MYPEQSLTRRGLLKSAAMAAPLMGLSAQAGTGLGGRPGPKMNVVLFMTDQERALQHFPPGWEERFLPGLTRLKRHGLTFNKAFTNACMCSPARSTWMTGFFPAQHGVKYTLEESMPASEYPQVELPLNLPNIGRAMHAAGFNVVYKGKWHCSKPTGQHWTPADLEKYGFARWNPPDAGANQDISQEGGGRVNNDGRIMNSNGDWRLGHEGAIAYLRSQAAAQQPFFLIVSLVNPHDVLFYPNNYRQAGYTDLWLNGDIEPPPTVNEDLSTKPTVQREFLLLSQGLGPLTTPAMKRNYLNFYGNLMRRSDAYLLELLETLDARGLTNDTLIIRTADHGEMGLAHGGLRQKNFNYYEESARIPLVYSNPRLYPEPRSTEALVSHVDFLPTIATLFGTPPVARTHWQGVDYARLVVDPHAMPVQDYVVFTYDDYQSGQPNGPYPAPPNHVVAIREQRYKLAEYYDVNGQVPSQWEMYDLLEDPNEVNNLAYRIALRPHAVQLQFERLKIKLHAVQQQRLQPLG